MPQPADPVSAAHLVLQAKQREIDALRQLAGRAELVDAIGRLIQALQRERGASSAFLASEGRRFAGTRQAAIADVAPAQRRLRECFAHHAEPAQAAGAQTLSLMAWVLLGLDALEALRLQIDRQALGAHDAVAAYSHLIAGLVELVFHMADAAPEPGISRLLVALLHLVQAQEAAGQERAVGALLFASARCSEAQQQRIVHLIDAQERSLQTFAEFADPALRERGAQLQLAPGAARLERLRRTLCTVRDGAALDSAQSDPWFEACSERIEALWQLQLALVQQLRAACAARTAAAQQELHDSQGLLRRLRDNPPARTHAVDRFFDAALLPEEVPALPAVAAAGESPSLLELLQAQSARTAAVEAELEAARRALHERKVIDRAKGVLMARLGMTEDAAFRALQKTSMDQNRRLLDVAEATLSLPDFAFGAAPGKAPR
ncbi:MAG: nitrate- and nitrite sensing domain-containing protein [Xylophilus ampelinus]